MRINHNLASLNTYRQLSANGANGQKSLEKLSSGYRINRAGDDAAGLAISEKMRAQIRGLDQANRNSQDGISMIQTAEGALAETQSILQRMRELATQSANDTNVGVDRGEIQKEMNQLTSEINRIGNTTEFNTQKLLKGDGSAVKGGDALELAKTGIIRQASLSGGNIQDATAAKLQVAMSVGGFTNVTTHLNGKTMTFKFNGEAVNLKISQVDGAEDPLANTIEVLDGGREVKLNLIKDATNEEFIIGKISEALQQAITTNANIDENNFQFSRDKNTITIESLTTGTGQSVSVSLQGVSNTGIRAANAGAAFAALSAGAVSAAGTADVRTKASVSITSFTAASLKSQMIKSGIDVENTDYFNANGSVTITGATKFLAEKGLTIGEETIEFFNSNEGAYEGNADFTVDLAQINFAAGSNSTFSSGSLTTNSIINGIVDQIGTKMEDVTLTAGAGATTRSLKVTAKEPGETYNDIQIKDGASVQGSDTVGSTFSAAFQIGANQGQSMTIEITDMRAEALNIVGKAGREHSVVDGAEFTSTNNVTNGTDNKSYIAALDVSTHEKASAAITVINNAIEKVSAQRSSLGAFQNRLEHTINNLGTSSENLTGSESRIRDVDMAKEMMEFTKNNILSQAAQAMLAQANQQPQGVLQLLR